MAGPNTQQPSGIWEWIKFYVQIWAYTGFPFMFWRQPYWTTKNMKSQAGKVSRPPYPSTFPARIRESADTTQVVVVTGGNSGTGYATAKAYYEKGATVYIGCRSEERASEAIRNIKAGGLPNLWGQWEYKPVNTAEVGQIFYVNLDLTDFASIDAFIAEVQRLTPRLDILFANAGIMATDPGQYTKQGYDLQFGTNVLGHQRVIRALLPLLQATARQQGTPSRLVVLSSQGHIAAPRGGVDYDSLTKGGKLLGKWADYGQSKWGDIALSNYVAAHYGPGSPGAADGAVISTAIHPGLVATNLGAHLGEYSAMRAIPLVYRAMQVDTYTGALNQIWVSQVAMPAAEKLNGKYVGCYETIAPERPDLRDTKNVNRVWEWCNAQAEKHK